MVVTVDVESTFISEIHCGMVAWIEADGRQNAGGSEHTAFFSKS